MIRKTLTLNEQKQLHWFAGCASNIYILEDKKNNSTTMVDCGMPSDVPGLVDTLSMMPGVKRIVCTHFHVDHVSGWIGLKEIIKGCEIWFHEKAHPYITGEKRIPYPGIADFIENLFPCMKESGYIPKISDLFKGGVYATPFKKGFPSDRVNFFKNSDTILPGFLTIPTPGHRPDSVSYFDPISGILISGDFLIVMSGKTVINTFVSSKKDQNDSIEKIKTKSGIRFIYPGHGACRPFSVDEL